MGAALTAGGERDDAGRVITALVEGEGADALEIVPEESFPDDDVLAGGAFAGASVGGGADCGGARD